MIFYKLSMQYALLLLVIHICNHRTEGEMSKGHQRTKRSHYRKEFEDMGNVPEGEKPIRFAHSNLTETFSTLGKYLHQMKTLRSRMNLKEVDWDGEDSYLDALKSHSLFTSAANIHFLAGDDFRKLQKDRDSSEATSTKQENFAEDLLQTATPEHFDGPLLGARSHSPHGSRSHYGSHSQYGCGSKMGIFNLLTFLVYGFSLFVTLLSSTTLGNLLANILNANIVNNINTNTNTNTNENMNMNMNMNMNGRTFRFLAGVDAYASSFDDGRGREAKRSTSNLVNGSKIRNKFPTHVERFLGANLLVVFLQLTGRTPRVRPFCSIESLD